MSGPRASKEAGLTLVELLIVIAVLAILAVIIVPNVANFVDRGRSATYDTDQGTIQLAIDTYYSDQSSSGASTRYPTYNGQKMSATGVPTQTSASGPYINFSLIVGPASPLRDYPRSAGTYNATGVYTGSYSWYVDVNGKVQSNPAKQSNVYP